jgi:YgiT-type zinc finger domain-containing protein
MRAFTHCPLCGSTRIRRVREPVGFGRGRRRVVVRDVPFQRCLACREQFFDHESNLLIDREVERRRGRAQG